MLLLHILPEGGTFVQSLKVLLPAKKEPKKEMLQLVTCWGGGVLAEVSGKGREVHVEWAGLAESFGGAGKGRKIPEFEL